MAGSIASQRQIKRGKVKKMSKKPEIFRKRPVLVRAIQFSKESVFECAKFTKCSKKYGVKDGEAFLSILTLEGEMKANVGDWIIEGVNGEFYPCKPEIFEKTYEYLKGVNEDGS